MANNRLVTKEKVATYASVLLDVTHEAGGQQGVLEVRDQLDKLIAIMRTNADFASVMGDSDYSEEQREALVRNAFADCNPALVEVLAVMAKQGDFALLPQVKASFESQLESKLKLCVLDVTTVVALDDHLRDIIKKKAETELGMDVVLCEHIDASLLGGIVMSAGGKRIDASVLHMLDNARAVLKESH